MRLSLKESLMKPLTTCARHLAAIFLGTLGGLASSAVLAQTPSGAGAGTAACPTVLQHTVPR